MENIISYFGTYTPAADGAIANFKFEYLCTLGFAAIVIFLGRAIVAHSAALRKYAIPAPVVSGIIFSLLISAIKMTGTVSISFDAKVMKDLCQNLFFLCVGFWLQRKDVKTCRRKALRHDCICSLPPDHLSGCSRCCDRSPDQLKSAPRSSVFFLSDVRWCWYRICLWSDFRGLGCTGCYNDRCCGRYSW